MSTAYTYPACFYPDDDGITVDFPDLPGCVTCGNDMEEALFMADDAACGWILTMLENGEKLPPPTDYKDVKADEYENGFVNLMRLDIDAYAKKYSKKPVNKNCTIPTWLNTLAESQGLNFSQTLQEGLKQRLGLA